MQRAHQSWRLGRQTGRRLLQAGLVVGGLIGFSAANDAGNPPAAAQASAEQSCRLELVLPPDADVTIDGVHFGKVRRFVYSALKPKQTYQSTLHVRFADGRDEAWPMTIRGGRVLKMAISASDETPVVEDRSSRSPTAKKAEADPNVRPVARAKPQVAEVRSVVDATDRLAFDLYAQGAKKEGNFCLSPVSLEMAMAMVLGGARGQTAEQMAKTLHLNMPAEQVQAEISRLRAAWSNLGGEPPTDAAEKPPCELSTANALWAQTGYPLIPSFLKSCQTHFGAPLTSVDFQHDDGRQQINAWTARETRSRIEELIPPGQLSESTRLVLTAVVYFRGKWAQPFDPERTAQGPFHSSPTAVVEVPMMHQAGRFGYMETEDMQAVELPYVGGNVSLVILLPSGPNGLDKLSERLDLPTLEQWLEKMAPDQVKISLPRFRVSTQSELSQNLVALGMPDAFSNSADFSGISGSGELQLAEVIQQVYLDVNEEQTEAAAATAVTAVARSAVPVVPKVFEADHPFVFLLRDRTSGAILFLGRLANPSS